MATGATGQLGLALPVQGELSGTWGDTVNNGITQYTNIAIAGTLTLTGDGAVTLANTTGDASASNITSTLAGAGTVTAQFSTIRVSGTTVTKVVTGPSYSKSYLIDNASSYTVTFKASGQTGVSISPNEKVYVYYNATDYVKVGGGGITYGAVKTTTYTAVANDGVLTNTTSAAFTVNLPATPSTGTQVFIADSAGTWATNNLTIGRNGSTIAGSATDLVCDINSVSIQCIYDGTTWDIFAQIGANDTAVVTLNGTQTLTNKTLTSPVLTAPVLGTPASGTVTNLTGTASININGTVGATTANTGAFTTLSATGNGTIATLTGTGVTSYLKMTNTGQTAANGFQVQTVNEDVYVVNYSTAGNIFFSTNGSANNDMAINAAGGVQHINSISVGNATPSASGAGITFPATQSASSDANTLDDYEEGTWTPTVTFGGASVGITYNTTFTGATYTKIGNRVCISGFLLLTNKGSSTGGAAIANLPFTSESGNTRYLGVAIGGSAFTFANQFWASISPNATSIVLQESTEAGSASSLTNSDFTNGTELYFSATYSV
jgi:hypothetical protein